MAAVITMITDYDDGTDTELILITMRMITMRMITTTMEM